MVRTMILRDYVLTVYLSIWLACSKKSSASMAHRDDALHLELRVTCIQQLRGCNISIHVSLGMLFQLCFIHSYKMLRYVLLNELLKLSHQNVVIS